MSTADRPLLEELLVERAVFGLDEPRRRDLEESLASDCGLDLSGYERAAAALHECFSPATAEDLPAGLHERLLREAASWKAEDGAAQETHGPSRPAARREHGSRGALPFSAWGGWLAAAAVLGWALLQGEAAGVETPLDPDRFAAEVRVDWSPTGDQLSQGVSGEVLWSNSEQRGLMRFRGLDPNDPSVSQYQLWIFDEGRTHPVDGGVFDVPASGEVVVPIDAKLAVGKPVLFAVTLERPGGVVVSEKERLLLTAEVL